MEMPDKITVFWDDKFLEHEAPAGEFEAKWTGRLAIKEPHPDRPERVKNIKHILKHEIEEYLNWSSVTPATQAELVRVHDPDYINEFEQFCAAGGGRLTAETGANEATFSAARHAAGAAVAAVEHTLEHELTDVPYTPVRPSGHHAQPAQADGFCFFNNVAIAAEAALQSNTVERVAILDWDVHHGNGTQEVFYDRDDVLFISLHNDHWSWDPESHPQTGDLNELGTGNGEGYNLNVPLPPGTGDEGYNLVIEQIVEPILDEFDADLLLVSAGQDPGTVDPLGRNVVTKDGFENLGAHARRLAAEYTGNHLALIQEGGYQISHLGYATLGVLEGILNVETGVDDPFAWLSEDVDSTERAVRDIKNHFKEYWPIP